jgi:hypothetical protein
VTKQCRKCANLKEIVAFNKQTKAKDGLHSWCKECEKSEKAKYYSKNKEKLLDRVAKWEKANPEKVRQHKRAWRANNAERHSKRNSEWRYKNLDRVKDALLRKNFGISLTTYKHILDTQGHVCAICGQQEVAPNRALAVDHSHITGKVRGILCSLCNRGLGMFRDDAKRLEQALVYVRKHESK